MAGASLRRVMPFQQQIRRASGVAGTPLTMKAWCIHSYGQTDQLKLVDNMRIPPILDPNDVVVKVHASSINPIDVAMLGGYGSSLFNARKKLRNLKSLAKTTSEFPLVLGRDISGVVIKTGHSNKSKGLSTGDEVFGCVQPLADAGAGAHAEYVVVNQSNIVKKPDTLSFLEAASIPYAALTVWSALTVSGGLSPRKASGKRVLVLGGSGGAGCFAIQLLKAWKVDVTTTCSADAVDLLGRLGADYILNYSSESFRSDLKKLVKFDLILDCAAQKPDFFFQLLNKNGKFVTLNSPILNYMDQYGLVTGLGMTALKLGSHLVQSVPEGKHFRYAFVMPNRHAMKTIGHLCENSQIVPVIQRVFPFERLPEAFDSVAAGHNRGKTVIEMVPEDKAD